MLRSLVGSEMCIRDRSWVEPYFGCCIVPRRSQPSVLAEIWPRGTTVYFKSYVRTRSLLSLAAIRDQTLWPLLYRVSQPFFRPGTQPSGLARCVDLLARQRCRRLLLSGFATRPHAMRGRCSHVIAGIAYCPPVGHPYRARCVVCVNTSSPSSLVMNGFDTLPRLRAVCGLC